MKKLFDKVGKKREKEGSLVGKVVMVGQYSVKVEALIGEGGFATIYRCVDMKSGLAFALKHMRLAADTDAIKEVQQEAKTMARLKGHPNILKLHAVAFAGPPGAETDGFMLLDFCPVTLLEVMQRSNFVLDDFLVYEVFQDVAWAVAHMHKCTPPLAHRDLKAENVLKNSEGRWVICDFGSSTARAQVYDTPAEIATEEDNIRRTTTPAYRAPEMWDLYSRQRIDTAVDVWALGVLLYVLAFGKLPFQGDSKLSILYGKYDMPQGRPPAMRALVQDMLQVNPADRPDIFQVISKLDVLRAALSSEGSSGNSGGGALDHTLSPPPPPLPSHPHPQPQPAAPAGAAAPAGPQYHPPHPHPHPHPHPQPQPHNPHAHPHGSPYPPPPPYHPPQPQPGVPHLPAAAPPPYPGQPSPRPGPPAALPGAAVQPPHPHPHPHPQQPLQQYPAINGGPPGVMMPSRAPGAPPPAAQPHPQAHPQHPYPHVGPRPGPTPPAPAPCAHPGQGAVLQAQLGQQQQPGGGALLPPHQQTQQGQVPPPHVQLQGSGGSFRGGPRPVPGAATGPQHPHAQQQLQQQQLSRSGSSFAPAWPAAAGVSAPQQQQQLQPPNLLDDDSYPEPAAAAVAHPSVFDSGFGGAPGPSGHSFPGPDSSHLHSNSQLFLSRASSAAVGSSSLVGFGGDNADWGDSDWGEQPAFSGAPAAAAPVAPAAPSINAGATHLSSTQIDQRQDDQPSLLSLDDEPSPAAPASAAVCNGASNAPAAGAASPAPPHSTSTLPRSNSGACINQAAANPAPAAPVGPVSPATVPAPAPSASPSAAAVPPPSRSSSSVMAAAAVVAASVEPAAGASWGSTVVVSEAREAPLARAASSPTDASIADAAAGIGANASVSVSSPRCDGPVDLLENDEAADGEAMRAQLLRLAAVNSQLEGRVRQLEDLTATQGAMLQRLATELRSLQQQQQRQQPQQPPLPEPQPQQQHSQRLLLTPEQPKLEEEQQPQQRHPQASQDQGARPLLFIDAPAWPQQPAQGPGSTGDAGSAVATGTAVAAGAAVVGATTQLAASAAAPLGGSEAVVVSSSAGTGAGDSVGGSSSSSHLPRVASAAGFATEPWGSSGFTEATPSGSAIYPAIRYEDLA